MVTAKTRALSAARPGVLRVIAVALLCTAACGARKSLVRADDPLIRSAPTVRVAGEQAWLSVPQRAQGEDPRSIGAVDVDVVSDQVHVFATKVIPYRAQDREFALDLPPGLVRGGLSGRVFWRNPDGSLHPVSVSTGEVPGAQ